MGEAGKSTMRDGCGTCSRLSEQPQPLFLQNWRPFVHLILVSSESPEDYKARARPRLRQTVNEDFPVCGRRVVAFVRPRHLEISAKGPKKVYDLIAEDCTGSGRKPLAVHCRLDPPTAYGTPFSKAPPPLAGHLLGLGLLKDALRSALGTEVRGHAGPEPTVPRCQPGM